MIHPKDTGYVEQLMEIGLSEKEARVYLSLLHEGDATADTAAKQAGLNRSTTYVQLETLMEKGLASTFKRGKKTFFAAESPANIQRLLDREKQRLETKEMEVKEFLPDLLKEYGRTGTRPVIRTFEGKEGMKTMRNEILHSDTTELLTAGDFDDLYGIFTTEELMGFSNARVKKGMKSYVIYTKAGDDAILIPPQELRRVPKDKFPFPTDVYIYGDRVSFALSGKNISGATIMHNDVATAFRSLFWLAWHSAKT